jgi:hypothetical protein
MPETPVFYTKQSWAKKLDLSTRTLERAIAAGRLKAFRAVGSRGRGRVMIREDDVAIWLTAMPVEVPND